MFSHARPTRFYRSSVQVGDLHDEVLREIFIGAFPQRVFEPSSIISPAETISLPVCLSHVCRRWRIVSLSFCELWSYLYLSLGNDNAHECRRIVTIFNEFLDRTGEAPLNFRFHCDLHGSGGRSALGAAERIITGLFLRQMRWRDVNFKWNHLTMCRGFQILGLSMNYMPLLRSLILDVSLKKHDGKEYCARIDLSRSSHIEVMHLSGNFILEEGAKANFDVDRDTKRRLSRCTLKPTQEHAEVSSAQMCMNILRNSPNLQYVDLCTMNPFGVSATLDRSTVTLPNLKKLHLKYGLDSETILEKLHLPGLEELHYADGNSHTGGRTILDFIQRSRPLLTCLAIRNRFIQEDTLVEVLRSLPTLIELDITNCPTTTGLIRALEIRKTSSSYGTPNNNDMSTMCPRLNILRLQRVPHYQNEPPNVVALYSMIKSRRKFTNTFNRVRVHGQKSAFDIPLTQEDLYALKSSFESGRYVWIETVDDALESSLVMNGGFVSLSKRLLN